MTAGWIAATGAVLACAGCGFKGPLYLPEPNPTVVTHPAPAQGAPATAAPGQAQSHATKSKDKSPPPSSAPPP
jgi:predicted small lipoprotein YifL